MGFTTVEILIVVAILAILAMIVVPQWGRASGDARESRIACDVQTVRKQIAVYQAQHAGRTPDLDENGKPDTAAFVARLTGKTDSMGRLKGGELGPYLTEWPTNPLVSASVAGEVKFGASLTPPCDGTTGWYFSTTSGIFSANHWRKVKTDDLPTSTEPVRVAGAHAATARPPSAARRPSARPSGPGRA